MRNVCVVVALVGVALGVPVSGAAQIPNVSAGDTIKASDINAIIDAVNGTVIPVGNLDVAGFLRVKTNALIDVTTTSPGGFNLGIPTTLVVDTGQSALEEAFLALNGNTAIILSTGDLQLGLLQIVDGDGDVVEYKIFNNEIRWVDHGTMTTRRIRNDNDGDLELQTDGGMINFYTDLDNDTVQTDIMRVFRNGTALNNRLFQLDAGGNLEIDGTLTENFAFDLAEAFLASEPLQPGELVAVDPRRPDAVRRAAPGDRAVLGVISEQPGVLLGGGAFSVERLEQNWGPEVAARFRADQQSLEAEALRVREDLQQLTGQASSFTHFATIAQGRSAAASIKPEDMPRLQAEFADAQERLDQELEAAALDLFFEHNVVAVALAGRVPVQVDAGNGAIAAGDLLALGSRPGTAAKAVGAGPVVGMALEPHSDGVGEILMLVQRGWHGPMQTGPVSATGELESLRRANVALERQLAAMGARLTAVEQRLVTN